MLLQIVISSDLRGCEEASVVAAEMRRLHPDLSVELVVLGPEVSPEERRATPRYLLDGVQVSGRRPKASAAGESR
jgi:hypothetical protein